MPPTSNNTPDDLGSRDLSLLIVAHGSESRPAAVAGLSDIIVRLRQLDRFRDVAHATLAGGPDVASALRTLEGERVLVVPYFMSPGYFVETVLPDATADDPRVIITSAIGISPHLAPALDVIAAELAAGAGWRQADCDLLLVGHGSPNDPSPRQATEAQAARIGKNFSTVSTAFLEEPPYLADVIAAAKRQLACLGFFAAEGAHAAIDVPNALKAAPIETRYSGAVGAHPVVNGALIAHIDHATAELKD
ncbi:MAG: CbiX/SirB N-terminal domain-containing protein [Rhodospirillaceae bacterium]